MGKSTAQANLRSVAAAVISAGLASVATDASMIGASKYRVCWMKM